MSPSFLCFLLPILLLMLLAVTTHAKTGWVCNTDDGYWYQNGEKTKHAGCQEEKKSKSGGDGKDDSKKEDGKKDDGKKEDGKAEGGKAGWVCNTDDGFWYQDGKKSSFSGCRDDKKLKDGKMACTATNDPEMPAEYTKTCISAPPADSPRCWYTHVPKSVLSAGNIKVPVVIDMHGGGMCASSQMRLSGFKELSDSFVKGEDSFVTIWPQGYENGWGMCGADCDAEAKEAAKIGKKLITTDDITFLMDMIAYVLKSTDTVEVNPGKDRIDATRIYLTGFSLGCMMSHRLALEKSDVVAGFGCHGGTLIGLQKPDDPKYLAEQRTRFKLQPMPAYMTGGTNDEWFNIAKPIFGSWSTLNECSNGNGQGFNVTLPAGNTKKGGAAIKSATLKRRSSCSGGVQVVRLELIGGVHTLDARMAKYTWEFLKSYTRANALASLGPAPASVEPEINSVPAAASFFPLLYISIFLFQN